MKQLILLLLTTAWLPLAGRAAVSGQPESGDTTSRLNVLFIVVDDLRCQLGCYGDATAITPNIDNLAARGLVFDRAYCQQAVCNPSRASVMTGLRPNTTKVWDLKTHFRKALPDVVTLPQYFKMNGYHTQSVGKIYHDPAWAQDAPSWSVPETMAVTKTEGKYVLKAHLSKTGSWKTSATERADVPDNAYIDGQVREAAVEILTEIKDKPFFLAVGFRRPHLPFSAPEKYWKMYDRNSLPLPKNPDPPANVPDVALHQSVEMRGYRDIPDSGPFPEAKMRELIHGYYASTTYVDAQIGMLLQTLDRLHLREKTVVVLWGDHGYHLGEHGLWCKTTNFELDTRVPLIISLPGQHHRGEHTKALTELVDLYPTLVDLAGLRIPTEYGLAGTNLRPVLGNPRSDGKEAAYSQFPRPASHDHGKLMGYSVRTDRYRYTQWEEIESGKVVATELYDHRKDALETNNVAGSRRYKRAIPKLRLLLRAMH